MALIDCPECGQKVSDRAPTCPHCGIPLAASTVPPQPSPESGAGLTGADDASPPSQFRPQGDGHIFVSYKSEDRHRARVVAEALERRGWPVWWDRDIQAGQAFRRAIQEALDNAQCVVVLWTIESVNSEWVLEEAQDAKARRILVPVLLDDVRQPLGFGQTQAASLVGWDGDAAAEELDGLLRGVATQMGAGDVPPLLDADEWEAIVRSSRDARGRAAAARATEERAAAEAAADVAERAAAEREAAAHAGEHDVAADAARRQAKATAAAERATRAAEDIEAAMAAELAAEHAAELRAVAARKRVKEAEATAAEEAAQRTTAELAAEKKTADREAALRAAEREAKLRAAAEATRVAEEAAAPPGRGRRSRSAAAAAKGDAPAKASWFRFPAEGIATLVGAILVGVTVYMPWVEEETAMDFPLEALSEFPPEARGSSLGAVLLAVAITGGALALFRIPRWITVILGLSAIAIAIVFPIQVLSFLTDRGTAEEFFDLMGVAPAGTLLGGLLMLSGR